MKTRLMLKRMESHFAMIYKIEPKCVEEVLKEESWILMMQEELNQFKRNNGQTLVPKPDGKPIVQIK